jgi:hypothetical protein
MSKVLLAGVAALSVLSAPAAHAQTTGTLTLACRGVYGKRCKDYDPRKTKETGK